MPATQTYGRSARKVLQFTLHFPSQPNGLGGFIDDPLWPERETLINIQKESGMNRAKSDAKRQQALSEYLKRQGITPTEYHEIELACNRQWVKNEDGFIVVTAHKMYGCLIAACDNLSASQRPCAPEQLRHVLMVSDFITDRKTDDGIFSRAVQPKSGTGQVLSNQRATRMNPFIVDFHAVGTIAFFPDQIQKADELPDFLAFAGERCGVGSSRKMGFGRFLVEAWE